MEARAARILKAAGPPNCRYSVRMSGVLTKKLGRKYADDSWLTSLKYVSSSFLVFRHVK
ncbi:hypothetical protein D3C85_1859490 [compost metagenome]